MVIKALQLSGGHGFFFQMGRQPFCIFVVGARQRDQNPACCPSRYDTAKHLVKDHFGQGLQQVQPPLHKGLVASHLSPYLSERTTKTAVQFLDESCLFDGLPGPVTALNQKLRQGLHLGEILHHHNCRITRK